MAKHALKDLISKFLAIPPSSYQLLNNLSQKKKNNNNNENKPSQCHVIGSLSILKNVKLHCNNT